MMKDLALRVPIQSAAFFVLMGLILFGARRPPLRRRFGAPTSRGGAAPVRATRRLRGLPEGDSVSFAFASLVGRLALRRGASLRDRPLVEDLSNFSRQRSGRNRLLEKRDSRIENAVSDDAVVR